MFDIKSDQHVLRASLIYRRDSKKKKGLTRQHLPSVYHCGMVNLQGASDVSCSSLKPVPGVDVRASRTTERSLGGYIYTSLRPQNIAAFHGVWKGKISQVIAEPHISS